MSGALTDVVVLEVLDGDRGGRLLTVDGVGAEISGYEMTPPACDEGW